MPFPLSTFTKHLLLYVGLSIMEAMWETRPNAEEWDEERAGQKPRLFYQIVIIMTLWFLKMGQFFQYKLYSDK